MNEPERDTTRRDMTADDDRRFDLLVDGELNPAERRRLLANLDDEPGGWRRCALAFLEAQAWREDFGVIRTEADSAVPSVSAASPRKRSRLLSTTRTLMAMAASFLAALAMGWYAFGPERAGSVPGGAPVEVAEKGAVPDRQSVDAAPQPADQRPETAPENMNATERPWRWVTLTPDEGIPDGTEPIRLPAVETDRVDEAWLRSLPEGVPAQVLDALREAGHRVRHERRLVPFRLGDGRNLLVPVDEVDVHYVGNELYQ